MNTTEDFELTTISRLRRTSASQTSPGEAPRLEQVNGEERNMAGVFILINANIGFCTEERGRLESAISLGCIGGEGCEGPAGLPKAAAMDCY